MRAAAFAVPAVCLAAGILLGLASRPPAAPVLPPATPSPRAPAPVAPGEPDPGPGEVPAEGEGRIEGTVRTTDGEPLPGVLVAAWREMPREHAWPWSEPEPVAGDGPPEPDRARRAGLRDADERSRYRAATRRDAVSGRDGSFVLSGLPDGYHLIRAFLDGHRAPRGLNEGGAWPGATVELVLEPIRLLPIRVLGPDGSPPARAEVTAASGRRRADFAWSPERQVMEIGPGRWTLVARVGGTELESEPAAVEIGPDPPPAPVRLELESPRGIRGTVAFPRGTSRAFHEVVALELPPGANPAPERLIEEGSRDSLFGGSSDYAFRDLEPGRYLVGVVGRHGKRVLASAEATVSDAMEVLDFVLPGADEPAEGTLVRLLDPEGQPEPWATVHVERGTSEAVGPGEVRVFPAAPADPKQPTLLRIRSERYGDLTIPLDPAAGPELEVRFEAPAFLTVVLPGYAGSPYEGRSKLAVVAPGQGSSYVSMYIDTAPDPEGRQTFGPLPPGEREVVLCLQGGFGPFRTVPVTLVSGHREIALDLPPLHTLTVIAEGDRPGEGFYLEAPERSGPATAHTPVRDGAFRFEMLPAGEYVLCRHLGPRERMPLTIAGDVTVRFRPVPFDALRIRVKDPEGALARAGLRDGDLVVAIDGTEITGEQQGYALLRAAEARGRGVLTLLRGGARRDVETELAGIGDPARSGGEIRAWTR